MVVLLLDRSHPGGIWGVLHPIAEALRDRGDDPVLVRWHDRPGGAAEVPEGIRAVDVEAPPRRFRADVPRQLAHFRRAFAELLRAERPDVVHANFVLPGAPAVRAARAAGVRRVVLTRHELRGALRLPLRLLDAAVSRRADVRTYVSRAVAESYAVAAPDFPGGSGPPAYGAGTLAAPVPADVVVHNGIDLTAADAAVAAAGPRDPDRLVCAGRLDRVKGQATLLRALPAVLRDRPGARLELIGDGPDRGRLEGLAGELGVRDRVTFAGWRPRSEALRAFAGAGAVAVPSDGTQEGFGLTIAEAAAAGAALVVSDIPVFREVLGGGERGGEAAAHWFRPGDAAGCAAAVAAALAGPAPGVGGPAAAAVRGAVLGRPDDFGVLGRLRRPGRLQRPGRLLASPRRARPAPDRRPPRPGPPRPGPPRPGPPRPGPPRPGGRA